VQRWGVVDLEGVEVGNAWALRSPDEPQTNWFLGDHPGIPADSLRFLRHGGHPEGGQVVENLALKWFHHDPGDPTAWGEAKPISSGHSLSLLAGPGAFELRFSREGEELRLLLEAPGDFALWGPGLGHSWRALEPSVVMTLRWQAVEGRTPPTEASSRCPICKEVRT
jgi:hypothetical protein